MHKFLLLFLAISSSLFSAPKAVVFDFGGVMTGKFNREAVVHFLCQSFHLSKEEFQRANSEKREAAKRGVGDVEFWMQYAEENGIDLPLNWESRFNEVMIKAINPNASMYQMVDQLQKEDVVVALLSNIDARLANLVRGFNLYEPFCPCLLSCDIGVEKPDPRAYRILLTALQLPAEDVVFIDDKEENVEAALDAGIDALLFRSKEQLFDALEKRGLLSGKALAR